MKQHHSHALSGLAWPTVLVSLCAVAAAPEMEVGCVNGVEYTERWNPAVAASGIPWEILVPSAVATAPVGPGFPQRGAGSLASQTGYGALIRAAKTWNDAEIWPGGPDAATCKYSEAPSVRMISPQTTGPHAGFFAPGTAIMAAGGGFLPPDGKNSVTLWEDGTTLAGFLAATSVVVALPGHISEFDVVLNATQLDPTTNAALFSFVEENATTDGRWYTTTRSPASSFTPPFWGYHDLQGVMTHELGLGLGLGNSLDDSHLDPARSDFPSMYPRGQIQDFTPTFVDYHVGATAVAVAGASSGAAVAAIASLSARDLTRDDISSVGAGYPTSEFTSQLGSISGVARLNGAPVRGALVVAIAKLAPESVRVAVTTRKDGGYTVPGLLPGDYYVWIQPITADSPVVAQGPGYFRGFEMPTYLSPGSCAAPANQTGGTPFDREFYNSMDAASEEPMKATVVAAQAGAVTSGIDLTLANPAHVVPNYNTSTIAVGFGGRLNVQHRAGNPGHPTLSTVWSSRGRAFGRFPFGPAVIYYEAADAANTNKRFIIAFSDALAPAPTTGGQLSMLDTTSPAFVAWQLTVGTSGNVRTTRPLVNNSVAGWQISTTIGDFPARTSTYCQVFETDLDYNVLRCSNMVNVWRGN